MRRARLRLIGALFMIGSLAACGAPGPAGGSSPSAAASPAHSIPAVSPTPEVRAGAPAWVAVGVASGWRSPQSPRVVDAPALQNPAEVRAWLAGMTAADKVGLIDRLDTQVLLGDEVLVLQVTGAWAQVVVPEQSTPLDPRGYPAWIPVRQLTAVPPPDAGETVTVTSATAWLRGAGSSIEVSFGTTLPLLDGSGASYVVGLPGGASMTIAAGAVSRGVRPASASAIIAGARQFKGLPYLWGGTSGFGFDCSGLVHMLYAAYGVAIPRDSDPQSRYGTPVSRQNLQPGDLVFFSAGGNAYHVAIYSGNGMVIDSRSPGYPVEEVAMSSMPNIGDYSGARRVLPAAPPVPSPTPGLPKSLAGGEWTKLPTSDKVVALTFDAGGNNAGVAPIIAALKAAGVPATFFVTGRWTEVYPADARTIAAGYGIGNHTYDHPRLTSLDDSQVGDEISRAQTVIQTTTGRDPRPLFRFPYGSTDARVLADAHNQGYGGIRWTVDTLGWEGRSNGQSAATVEQRVLNALQPDEIVLMHVGAANDWSTLDADALPTVIADIEQLGYRLVLVADYVT